jgi:spermidine synthase
VNIFTGLQSPKVIYETESKFNGNIKVVEFSGVRRLVVDNITQSVSYKAPYTHKLYWGKLAHLLKESFTSLNQVLILGVGGGTLIHLIHEDFPNVSTTSVDIDQTMVDIANNYFDLATVPNNRIIVDDAMRLVIEPHSFDIQEYQFDVVIVDIYVGEKYPDLGKSGNFIGNIKNLVNPGGMIIFNRIYREHHQEDVNIFIDYVSEFFTDVKSLIVAGYTNSDNVLIYARV